MDAEEINGLLWDALAAAGRPLRAQEISLETGQPMLAIQSALASLRQADLVEVVPAAPESPATPASPPSYRAILELDALRWAQAVGLGVGLLSLERHARLSSAVRARGLKMATDGSLERLEARKRTAKRKSRDAAIHGRAASRAAASDLAQILEDTRAALARASCGAAEGRSRAIALLLEQANDQAQRALDGLVKSLASK